MEPTKPTEFLVSKVPADWPAPAAGRFELVPRRCAKNIEDGTDPGAEWVLRWGNQHGADVLAQTDGFLVRHDPAEATWLPKGWKHDVYPAGRTPAHVLAWLSYAIGMTQPSEGASTKNRADRRLLRRLVAHAYLLVGDLGIPHSPTEPHVETRRECWAALSKLLAYFRRKVARGQVPSAVSAATHADGGATVGNAIPPHRRGPEKKKDRVRKRHEIIARLESNGITDDAGILQGLRDEAPDLLRVGKGELRDVHAMMKRYRQAKGAGQIDGQTAIRPANCN